MGGMKKVLRDVAIVFHSIFRGMASADSEIIGTGHDADGSEMNQHMRVGGAMDDMLQGKETQDVKETRDEYYRILREADKYDASNISMNVSTVVDGNGEEDEVIEFGGIDKVRKKTKEDYMRHCEVYNEKGYTIRTIQDNKIMQKYSSFLPIKEALTDDDYDVTLTVERDGFMPRYRLEKMVKKMVVRQKGHHPKRAIIDLYLPTEASQFGKIDAIVISNLYRIWKEKNLRSDLTDFKTIEWFSDKAWNSDDVCLFKYDDVKFKGVEIYDGNFVLSFSAHIVNDGTYLADVYKMKEVTEKYENEAAKSDNVDIFAAQRRNERQKEKKKLNEINIDNLENQTIDLS